MKKLIMVILTVFLSIGVGAATYYVDVSGNDSNPGSESQPFASIQHAANTIQAGDTVIVRSGTYDERVTVNTNGSSGNKITFKAEPRRTVEMQGFILNGEYLEVEGFNISYQYLPQWQGSGVWISGDNANVIDNYIYNTTNIGIRSNSATGANNTYIVDNYVYHSNGGIWVKGDNILVEKNEIERMYKYNTFDSDYTRFFGNNITFKYNYFHGTLKSEVGTSHVDGWQVFNNDGKVAKNIVIENNIVESFDQGIILEINEPPASAIDNILIRNNVFDGRYADGHLGGSFGILTEGHNIHIYNNLFANLNSHGVAYWTDASGIVRNNIFYNVKDVYNFLGSVPPDSDYSLLIDSTDGSGDGSTFGPHDITNGSVNFQNPNNWIGNDGIPFNADDGYIILEASDSIDSGTSLADVTEDIFGTQRPLGNAYDIGPFEFDEAIPNCPEGALQIIDDKARLISDLFCDGLGACIGHCPEGAITIEEREAEPYNEEKVMKNIIKAGPNTIKAHLKHLKDHGETKFLDQAIDVLKKKGIEIPNLEEKMETQCGCPGAAIREVNTDSSAENNAEQSSALRQWPVQLTLLPAQAPFFDNAHLLVSADCVPFANPNFHIKLLNGKSLVIGCPKLDDIEAYKEKLTEIFKNNNVKSVTVAIMEVPCCYGLYSTVEEAVKDSGKKIPVIQETIGVNGEIQ